MSELEEILENLQSCAEEYVYFEIDYPSAQILWRYIRDMEDALEWTTGGGFHPSEV